MTDTDATKEVDHATAHDEKVTPLVLIKYVLSCALLTFSIVIVGALMFTGNTRISSETNPWVCLLVCVSYYCAALLFLLPSYQVLVFDLATTTTLTKFSNLVTATVSTPPSFLLYTGLGRHLAYDD